MDQIINNKIKLKLRKRTFFYLNLSLKSKENMKKNASFFEITWLFFLIQFHFFKTLKSRFVYLFYDFSFLFDFFPQLFMETQAKRHAQYPSVKRLSFLAIQDIISICDLNSSSTNCFSKELPYSSLFLFSISSLGSASELPKQFQKKLFLRLKPFFFSILHFETWWLHSLEDFQF